MLAFGKVSKINEDNYTVKVKLDSHDGFETPWLSVPMPWTRNNKAGFLPEIQSLCAVILSEEMTEGFYLGAIYNDDDKILVEYKGQEFIHFADGVTIAHKPDSKALMIKADKVIFDCDIECTKDISDKNGTVQSIRDWANTHTHRFEDKVTNKPTSEI